MRNSLSHGFLNVLARVFRSIRRRWFPRFDVRSSPVAVAYLRWIARAARLGFVEGIHGHRMYLDDQDSLGLSIARTMEPTETRIVQESVRAGTIALDIGANIGYYTLLLARAVGPAGRVFAFEPDPTNFSLLRRNVEINGYDNVTLVNAAVWSRTTELKLYLSDTNRGDHRSYESDEARASVSIPAVCLDDYFAGAIPRVDFIKMDIQGAECHALRGMETLLHHNPHARLVTEFWPAGLIASGTTDAEYLALLSRHGYRFVEIGDAADTLTHVTAEQLLLRFREEHDGFTNLLCEKSGPVGA